MRFITKVILTILVTILLTTVGSIFFIRYSYYTPLDNEQKIIYIPEGSSVSTIRTILNEEGLLSLPVYYGFNVILRVKNTAHLLKAGEYEIPAGVSPFGVVNIISSGQVLTHKMTFPEGKTVSFVLNELKNNALLEGEITLMPTEGMLEPNTYVYTRGTKRDKLIAQMMKAQQKNIDEVWEKRQADLPIKSKEELLTLASIVEKETGIASERPLVASAFINRLRQGIKLQSDPTIIYGITKGEVDFQRAIYRTDIMRPTEYNTYTIAGLPPTAICNPGRDALEAVANPADTNYIFFVANGTGGHSFSATLAEHNQNVSLWRKIEKSKK